MKEKHQKGTSDKDRHANAANMRDRLAWLRAVPDGLIYSHRNSERHALVFKRYGEISLFFGDPDYSVEKTPLSGAMSRIDPDNPLSLLGVYTQAMMLAVIWNSNPGRIHVLGLGGGRLPMVLHHYFPDAVIDCTEIDAVVAGLSEDYFGFCQNDHLRVSIAEGREFLAKQNGQKKYDIILVDCFTETGYHPFPLSTAEFYDLCGRCLNDDGVVATNLIDDDPMFEEKVNTFQASFGNVYQFARGGTAILFGSPAQIISETEFMKRAKRIHEQFDFAFPFYKRAKKTRPLSKSRRKYLRLNFDILRDVMWRKSVGREADDPHGVFRHQLEGHDGD